MINSRMQEQQFCCDGQHTCSDYSRHRGHWCICARYRDIESKYLELKKQIRRSKKNKMCYACSKFITSNLAGNFGCRSQSRIKKYKGNNVLAKQQLMMAHLIFTRTWKEEKTIKKFEDVSRDLSATAGYFNLIRIRWTTRKEHVVAPPYPIPMIRVHFSYN